MDGYKIIKVKNGDSYNDFAIYKCNQCGCGIPESDPHYIDIEQALCWECAFRLNLISEKEFIKHCGVALDNVKAGISPISNEIEITTNKYFSWERPVKQQRNTPQYIAWRKAVFKRDNYTCQACGKKGGILNAHHIESFAKNKRLRTALYNGITLCECCHKYLHKGVVKLE